MTLQPCTPLRRAETTCRRVFSFWFIVFSFVLLTACSNASERREKALQTFGDVRDTASGAVTEVQSELEDGASVVREFAETMRSALAEVERRWISIREGMGKIREGKELLEEGVKGTK